MTTSPPSYTAQAEKLADCMGEFVNLMDITCDEVAIGTDGLPYVPALDVHVDAYLAAEVAGLISFVALRDGSGCMAGASVTMVHPQLHHRTVLAGVTDCFTLTDGAKAHHAADVLYEAAKAALQVRGVSRWFVGEPFRRPFPTSLQDAGFYPVQAYHALAMREAA